METISVIAAAVIAGAAAWFITRMSFMDRMKAQEKMHQKELENAERLLKQAQENYENALQEMKETVTASIASETQKLLKEREDELAEENQSNMESILKPLKESIETMRKAMKENETSHVETTARLSKQLEQAVKDMTEKTSDVGRKADSLSEALRFRDASGRISSTISLSERE